MGFEPAGRERDSETIMAWSKRAQSALPRGAFTTFERTAFARARGLALDSNNPDFGQLGNLRERREKRRSGRHLRLCGEIVLAHVSRRCPRTGDSRPRERIMRAIRGETHDAARRRTHHDNMVKAEWVKYPMDRSRAKEASATFSSKGLTCEDVHVCSTHGVTSPRRRHDRNSKPLLREMGLGVAGVEATPSTAAEFDRRGTGV